LTSQPWKPWWAAMATALVTKVVVAASSSSRCSSSSLPGSHSVMIVPSTWTPCLLAAVTQPAGGMVSRWWEK